MDVGVEDDKGGEVRESYIGNKAEGWDKVDEVE